MIREEIQLLKLLKDCPNIIKIIRVENRVNNFDFTSMRKQKKVSLYARYIIRGEIYMSL